MENLTQDKIAQLPPRPEILKVAEHVVWFKPPEEAIEDTPHFLAHLMTFGALEDILTMLKYLSLDDFRKALEQAPPGIIDARSWNYWNIVTGRVPVPPMPERHLT